MRDSIDNSELENIADAASLSRIKLRRPKEEMSPSPRKVKSGDITDRLQALAEELDASRPVPAAAPIPAAAAPAPARANKVAPQAAAPVKPAAEPPAVPEPKKAPLQDIIDKEHEREQAQSAKQSKITEPPAPVEPKVPEAKPEETAKAAVPPSSAPQAPRRKGFFHRPAKKVAADPVTSTPQAYMTPPPRRNGWARSTASQGWRKKVVTPDILTYWMDIREGNRYPTWHNLDIRTIGKYWPSCALVQCDPAGRIQLKNGFANDLRASMREEYAPDFEFSPMIMDWVLGLAREVAYSGKPAHGTEFFPSMAGEIPLRVIALPLSENQVDIDHVLCYVQKLN